MEYVVICSDDCQGFMENPTRSGKMLKVSRDRLHHPTVRI
jgi:hypothetical protein